MANQSYNQRLKLKQIFTPKDPFRLMTNIESYIGAGKASIITWPEIIRKLEDQFGVLCDQYPNIEDVESGKCIQVIKAGYADVRLHSDLYAEIFEKSLTKELTWTRGVMECGDFATSLFSEMNGPLAASRGFHRSICANIRISLSEGAHGLNMIWPSDKNDFMFVEPQTMRMYRPDVVPKLIFF